jgi:hypothetical protein
MISFQISPVIPTDTLWFAMLFLVGMLGLTGQVCSLVLSFSSAGLDPQQLFVKILLVMGLQRETASRATLANYTSVRILHHSSFDPS